MSRIGWGAAALGALLLASTASRKDATPMSQARMPADPNPTPVRWGQLTMPQASSILAAAYQRVMGRRMSDNLRRILLAHSSLETAEFGHKPDGTGFANNNWGNIRGSGPAGHWTTFVTSEGHGANARVVQPGPNNRFAVYESPEEGAEQYIRYLCTATRPGKPNMYQPAIDAAERGDVHGFVTGLASAGYFTADPGSYERSELWELQRVDMMLAATSQLPPSV